LPCYSWNEANTTSVPVAAQSLNFLSVLQRHRNGAEGLQGYIGITQTCPLGFDDIGGVVHYSDSNCTIGEAFPQGGEAGIVTVNDGACQTSAVTAFHDQQLIV